MRHPYPAKARAAVVERATASAWALLGGKEAEAEAEAACSVALRTLRMQLCKSLAGAVAVAASELLVRPCVIALCDLIAVE